jgi:hypothetical protein
MAKIWKEIRKDKEPSIDHMSGAGLSEISKSKDNLVQKYTYYVEVCGFTFEFASVEQIRIALQYYSQKTHSSSRITMERWMRSERDCIQRWYERVPQYLLEKGKREKVVKALQKALDKFS